MLGAGDRVEVTPELRALNKVVNKIWKAIEFNLIPRSNYYKETCSKCKKDGGYSHRQHLTKSEKRKDRLATNMLKKMIGAWNNYQKVNTWDEK